MVGVLRRCALLCGAASILTSWFAGVAANAALPDPAVLKVLVRSGGDRDQGAVTGLAGVEFGIFPAQDGADLTVDTPPISTCNTDQSGSCELNAKLDENWDSYFIIAPIAAPNGWEPLRKWGAPGEIYAFNTGPLQITDEQQVLQFPADDRRWPIVRDNPPAPDKCGIDLGLVIDLSGSVTQDEALFKQYRDAAAQFANALAGTPSRISAFTFATNASMEPPLPPTAVSTDEGVQAVQEWITSLTAPTDENATNWDQGLAQVMSMPQLPDVLLFLTDGDPNRYGNPAVGAGTKFHIRDLEEAIPSANMLKAAGTRVIAVGIGGSVDGPDGQHRLSVISGPVAGSDYVNTSFDDLATTLTELGREHCAGTFTIVKQVRHLGSDVLVPAGGWEFEVNTDSVNQPDGGETVQIETEPDTGAANLAVKFPNPLDPKTVTVQEITQGGYEIEPQGDHPAVCTVDGVEVPVTNGKTATEFQVTLEADQTMSCLVINRELPDPAIVSVDKTWSINGVVYPNGQQPAGFEAAMKLADPPDGSKVPKSATWGTAINGWSVGDTFQIDEKVTVPAGCTNSAKGLGEQLIATVEQHFAVTNEVTCQMDGLLTIDKTFKSLTGSTEPDAYTVTYAVTVKNPGPVAATYQLTDEFGFPDGIEVGTVTVTTDAAGAGPALIAGFDGVHALGLVGPVSIGAGESHQYLIQVSVQITQVTADRRPCTGAVGFGFFNIATLQPEGGKPLTDSACGPIPGTTPAPPTGPGTPVVPTPEPPTATTLSGPVPPQAPQDPDPRVGGPRNGIDLASTGVPVAAGLTVGFALVALGLILMVGRRRRHRPQE